MARILCIEDDFEQRQEIVEALTSKGFEVLEAVDGDSGLELILSERPDLILCDRMMAGKSGYALLEELREHHPDAGDIPFLFLTGLDDRRDMHATADLHPTEYLTKPIDLAVLISKIRKLTKTD